MSDSASESSLLYGNEATASKPPSLGVRLLAELRPELRVDQQCWGCDTAGGRCVAMSLSTVLPLLRAILLTRSLD